MTLHRTIRHDLLVWGLFSDLPPEEKVAVRLRYGHDLWKWYDENIHLPDRDELRKSGADEELLTLLDTVLDIREEKK